uniref:Conserved plasma membrane protein n=2 Tax=Schistosoma mansoni TaxID=6183 RepID=A0A5K4F9X3_SCHMA
MSLSRLSLLACCRRGLFVSPHRLSSTAHQGGTFNWLVENYPVTYLSTLVGMGVVLMIGYSIVCVAKNPDLYIPVYDRVPRDELFFNKDYFGAKVPETSCITPAVRMHYNGVLDLPYENKHVNPPNEL